MSTPVPRVLLIGAGRFGHHHLAELIRLQDEGRLELAGVVVRSEERREVLQSLLDVRVYAGLRESLLRDIDAVDIVTPPETHAALVETCLPHAHVLVEKPVATTLDDARSMSRRAVQLGRILMAGHVYRYHRAVRRLAEMVAALDTRPRAIHGQMINPVDDRAGRGEACLEFLHLFDIVDFLFGVAPEVCHGTRSGGVERISVRYPGPMNAVFEIGWAGSLRQRSLELTYDDREIACALPEHLLVTTFAANQFEKEFLPHGLDALRSQIEDFVSAVASGSTPVVGAEVGVRVLDIALRARPRARPQHRPRVGVVGGGVFGAAVGVELGRHCDIAIFERHRDLMTEASYVNQWRHHGGFHYPRSFDQVREIKATRGAFEAEYGEAVLRGFPAYFCTSVHGREIPAERYLAACSRNELAFTVERPPPEVVDPDTVSLCLKVDEGVYDFARLKAILAARLEHNPTTRVHLETEVVDATITASGAKRLTLRRGDEQREEEFDYLVNASYANRNIVAKWLGFPVEPLRFHFDELLLVRLPIAPICVSIVDGPFTSLVGTGRDGLFILSHALDSSHFAVITDDGLPPAPRPTRTNRENMLAHAAAYMPILRQAQVIESRYAFRAVPAFAKDFDARPTVITDHGFGCWSVLGGKILTCVSNAREIRDAILADGAAGS